MSITVRLRLDSIAAITEIFNFALDFQAGEAQIEAVRSQFLEALEDSTVTEELGEELEEETEESIEARLAVSSVLATEAFRALTRTLNCFALPVPYINLEDATIIPIPTKSAVTPKSKKKQPE